MTKFEKKFLENIQTKSLIHRDEKLLIALSGGPDSMALLQLLVSIRPVLNLRLFAAHCNFKLRDEDSDEDARFCKDQCKEFGITCYDKTFETKAYATQTKQSIEAAARELRYRFFDKVIAENQLDRLVTAHHANDNAETILFNLFRGSSLLGLKGIPYATEKVLRPLLFFTRHEIMDYLHHNNIPYRVDKTNASDDADRNFLRLKVIPLIESRFQHKLIPNLTRLSENGRELDEFIQEHINHKIKSLRIDFSANELSVTALKTLSIFEQKEIFKRFLLHHGIDPDAKRLAQLCKLLETQPGRKVVLNRQLEVLWKGKKLKLLRAETRKVKVTEAD